MYGISLILMDVAIAHRYGVGTQAAVYQAAYMVPTLLIGVFSGGAVLGAFVPVFIRLGGLNRHTQASFFLRSTAGTLLTLLIPLTALLIWAAPLLAGMIASGFNSAERQEVTSALRLMLLMLVPHSIAYVYYSALVSIGRVGLANIGPLLIPVAGIVSSPWWGESDGAVVIAISYFVGATLLALVTSLRLRLDGFRVTPIRPTRSPEWGVFLRDYLATGVAHATLAFLFLISQSAAASLSSLNLAAFSFGTKLVLLGLAFFTTIVNSVALPHFSSMLAHIGRHETWLHMRAFTLRAFVLTSFGSLLCMLLSDYVIGFVYAHGAFDHEDIELVGNVQRAFVLQVPFYVVGVFCWRMLNALGEWKPLLVATISALLLNILLVSSLASNFFAVGIALGYAVAIALWSLILLRYLRARLIS